MSAPKLLAGSTLIRMSTRSAAHSSSLNQPLGTFEIFAHRGLAHGCTENTLEAFTKAVEAGAHWIETDVNTTADGVVVAFHDQTLNRLLGISGTVGDSTWDDLKGRALMADGLATTLAGAGGGSGTTTYAENIGVMAATKVYSTAAYWVAAIVAVLLSVFPVFGAAVASVPAGVLGGAATVLYGMIGMLGVRIWVENRVDFSNQVNLTAASVALIVGIADYTWDIGDLQFAGIALGTAATLVVYHLMAAIARTTGSHPEPLTPSEAKGDAH